MSQVIANIFKAYDVRGIYPDVLTPELAYRIGRAFVVYLQPRHVVVGRDMRVSSPTLASALIDGLLDQGADVTDVGLISTDGLYFAVGKFGFDGGIMVTASHNPPEYNGFKLCRSETNSTPSYPGDWWKYIDGENTRSAVDTSVEGGHTYYYCLAVYDKGAVLGYSNAVKVTVPGQSQELSISLSATVEGGKVKLSWSVSGKGSYDGFKVCRSETNTSPSYPGDTCTFVDAGSRSYADVAVSPGHTYYYRVGIYCGGSIIAYSNAVKAVVP